MNNYTSIFHVGILDDLHNYFPDLLYNSDRFESVQSVLQYIQEQARTRCNPFEQGLRDYNQNRRPQNQTINPVPVQIPVVDISGNHTTSNISGPTTPPVYVRTRLNTPTAPLRRSAAYSLVYPDYSDEHLIGINSLSGINTLSNLFSLALNPSIANMIDVPIIPTNQQIDQSTTILAAHTIREPCAICQEGIDSSSTVRRINRCQHAFHRSCIDPWFETSVTCPICRTDIRHANDE
jgi:putative component of membrane protein insertase Oxa1/YidC/SpoIIIJ protein YidD